ncbi:hypothetical protein [Nonlabens sp.]|uniref:hypothetical protein n=1 Tax=Nonlabens sp. TaxID=1888209 RepID=UPI003F6A202C
MKNGMILFLFLSCGLAMQAQYQKATILFKNNSVKEGYIKVRANEGVKFKETEEDQPVVYTHKHIVGYDVDGLKYRYVRSNGYGDPSLFIEMEKGKIILYGTYWQGGSTMSFGPGTQSRHVDGEPYYTYHMLINGNFIRIGTKLKKRHRKMFKDCPALVKRLENGRISSKSIPQAIEFYNENCGS